ncbi:MAG: sulfatase-like hydrolase/transferase [SAR324 cluster bacterium]|nr:sulfatase-like hydrolase/transferase [SAR324 cluster bacterium]
MRPSNLLVIMSDQHNRQVLGCYGHPLVKTPHLDRLAARGTRFSDAYTNSPICVPARASFATGRYPHQIRHWDNADPYHGGVPSWGHRLMAQGHRVTSIGKLHYRSEQDDNGFDEEIVPLHVLDGLGDLHGLIRDELPPRKKNRGYVADAKGGESSYSAYDRDITARAGDWLTGEAPKHGDKPWMLFVSLVCPHPPFTAPQEFYRLYPHGQVPWPVQCGPQYLPIHPAIEDYRHCLKLENFFDEAIIRKAIAAYLGLVSFVDDNVGKILETLQATGLAENTRVIYTSDHGENLGRRGIWGKSSMYEEAAGVPLLMAGPEVPQGRVCATPVSLVDGFPTFLECLGAAPVAEDELAGHSLFSIAAGETPERTVFSEYHAYASRAGMFMIRKGPYKYIHYVGNSPQLFDLEGDPDELHNLAGLQEHARLLAECEADLRVICDPEAVDALAKQDQAARIAEHGGKEKILARGSFGNTPAPGEKPVFV